MDGKGLQWDKKVQGGTRRGLGELQTRRMQGGGKGSIPCPSGFRGEKEAGVQRSGFQGKEKAGNVYSEERDRKEMSQPVPIPTEHQ